MPASEAGWLSRGEQKLMPSVSSVFKGRPQDLSVVHSNYMVTYQVII